MKSKLTGFIALAAIFALVMIGCSTDSDNGPCTHAYGSWTMKTAATCIAAETQERTCALCGVKETQSVGDPDEDAHDWEFLEVLTAPTCSAVGYGSAECTLCGEEIDDDEIPIDSTAHNWGSWGVTTPATCSAAGLETRVCGHNGAHTDTRPIAIDSTAHNWGSWVLDTTPATCTEDGEDTRTCTHNAAHKETRDGEEALGHFENDWVWTTYNKSTGKVECNRAGCTGGFAEIGDTGPATGKIFYVATEGFTVQGTTAGATGIWPDNYTAHYLEAWSANEPNSFWGGITYLFDGITTFTNNTDDEVSLIGNGRKDTQVIVEYLEGTVMTDMAAQRCASADYGDFEDWFLPSIGEVHELYKSREALASVLSSVTSLWSSSQTDMVYTWRLTFSSGSINSDSKSNMTGVRAIRAF